MSAGFDRVHQGEAQATTAAADSGEVASSELGWQMLLDEDDLSLYRAMLGRGPRSLHELALLTAHSPQQLEAVLQRLVARGAVTCTQDELRRYSARPPEIAFRPALEHLHQAQADLQDQIMAMTVLSTTRSGGDLSSLSITLLKGADEVFATISTMLAGALNDVAVTSVPPYVQSSAIHLDQAAELHERGVTVRVLVQMNADQCGTHIPPYDLADGKTVDEPSYVGEVRSDARLPPVKLLLVDHADALVLARADGTDVAALRIRRGPLTDALCGMFDLVWKDAMPLWPGSAPDAVASLGPEDRRLLAMLTAGLTDAAIAGRLNISSRTVERRIGRLLKLLGVRTRFQLGAAAHKRGWLS